MFALLINVTTTKRESIQVTITRAISASNTSAAMTTSASITAVTITTHEKGNLRATSTTTTTTTTTSTTLYSFSSWNQD